MFKTIYTYELSYWLRQPIVYVYALLFFLFSFGLITTMSMETDGAFDGRYLNSTHALLDILRRIMMLLLLMLPAIFGHSVYRDWSSGVDHLLYAMPIRKYDYQLAKFGSAFTVFALVLCVMAVGFSICSFMPWANPAHFAPFQLATYFQLFGLLMLPNLFILGSVVFIIVLLSRNVYAGYLAVIGVVIFNLLAQRLLPEGNSFWVAILDPLGIKAFQFHSANWTLLERNNSLFPTNGPILWNRLLWITAAAAALFRAGHYFQLERGKQLGSDKQKGNTNSIAVSENQTLGLHQVALNFNRPAQLNNVLHTAGFHIRQIVSNRLFPTILLAALLLLVLMLFSINPRYGTEELPTSWRMIEIPSIFYAGVINAVTFLYAGLILQREKTVSAQQLIDATPTPDWVFMAGKFLALVFVQCSLLGILFLSGIITQVYKGFYEFNLSYYAVALGGILMIHFLIWAALALFVQSFLQRPYLALVLLLLIPMGMLSIGELADEHLGIGIFQQYWLRYNQGPGDVFGLQYSGMDGFGPQLTPYFIYKLYWALAAILLLIGCLLTWSRGFASMRERWQIAVERINGRTGYVGGTVLLCFLIAAGSLFHHENSSKSFFSNAEEASALRSARSRYNHLIDLPQPRITSVDIKMDLYPEERRFSATGSYQLINRSNLPIDTLIVNYRSGTQLAYEFDQATVVLSQEPIATLGNFDILRLESALVPGDTLSMNFSVNTEENTFLNYNTFVREQGTYFDDGVFPRIGNWLNYLVDRRQSGAITERPLPDDSSALHRSVIALDSDRINFSALVSTSSSQTAIAPGELVESFQRDGRNYNRFVSKTTIPHAYLFLSGQYTVAQEQWRGRPLKIYYQPGHDYNVDHIMAGAKASLDYCNDYLSPYQFDHARIVEFAQTGGASAHGFPGTIPAGESSCFLAAIHDHSGSNYAFGTAAHEIAHQWWGNQVIPADVRGAKLIVESTAEYINFRVKEAYEGKEAVRAMLKKNMQYYLRQRANDRKGEQPLIHGYPNQNYLWYMKGAGMLHTLGDYLGEKRLESALSGYIQAVAYQEGQYTTSLEFVEHLRKATPDSLAYLIEDCFETITFYDNTLTDWSINPSKNGGFLITVSGTARKFRDDGKGNLSEDLPLADYLEFALYDEAGNSILITRPRIDQQSFSVTFKTEQKPARIEIDPYYRFPDREREDNKLK